MEDWLYKLKQTWQIHKREIKYYGICAVAVLAGIINHRLGWSMLWVIVAACIAAYDRWGRKYAILGEEFMKGKPPVKPHQSQSPQPKPLDP